MFTFSGATYAKVRGGYSLRKHVTNAHFVGAIALMFAALAFGSAAAGMVTPQTGPALVVGENWPLIVRNWRAACAEIRHTQELLGQI